MVIFLNPYQIPFSLFNYIISNSGYIVKTILQLFAFFCKLLWMKSECHGGLALLFFLPTLLPAGRPFPWAGRYSPHSSLTLHYLLYRNGKSLSSFFCVILQLFCNHYHGHFQVSRQKCARIKNVWCHIQSCKRGLILEEVWLHYLGEISSPSLFWGKELQVCWI